MADKTRLVGGGVSTAFLAQSPGIYQILVSEKGAGSLTLQCGPERDGPWADTDVDFSDVGVKRFGLGAGFHYRLQASTLDDWSAYIALESRSRS